MSYSHDDEEHRDWVLQLSTRLRSNGVDVCLDRWNVSLGGNLAHYMERAANQKYRVIAVVSENFSRKCDEREGGAGFESQMLSARLYADLDSKAVIPVIRNNPHNPPVLPAFLAGRMYEDFRNDASQEGAYERLLREIHGVPVDAAPPLGLNPLEGRTAIEARLAIRNSPERWHSPAVYGDVEFVYSQNSGKYGLGSGSSQFTLDVGRRGLGTVYVLNDPGDIANVAVINRARERTELLADVSEFDLSSRIVDAGAGDAVVLHNRNGFWALVYITKVHAREALNRELVINFRFQIQLDRTPDFSGFKFPDADVTG
ncbi:SEFIR domain protein [Mycobacteroides salmoniphilum]|uniref:SEFIR domain protein n=2 Tax=Mycobacteroides salmoniphilum TaxID=404941 RepID=A0A4R8RWD2_9MYCO|nr:SEFIR domain protein [Mycobacteroides salmoniphilum]